MYIYVKFGLVTYHGIPFFICSWEQQQQQWQKRFIKSVFKLFQNSSLLFQVIIVKLLMLMSFPGVELSRTV